LAGPFGSFSHETAPQTAAPQGLKRTFVTPSVRSHSPFTSAAKAAPQSMTLAASVKENLSKDISPD
jgi:hypothetical protein